MTDREKDMARVKEILTLVLVMAAFLACAVVTP